MAFGSFANGGASSSSSNLSALAPPFTFDRPLSIPLSTPFIDSADSSYSLLLNSSLNNWLPSHPPTTGLNCLSSSSSISDSAPSSNVYRHSNARNIKSPNTKLPPLNPIELASTDSLITNVIKAKPYYPSYMSASIKKDTSSVIPDQSVSEGLHTSFGAPYVSYLEDYGQGSLGSDSVSNWGCVWDGLGELNQGNLLELSDTQSLKETKLTEAHGFKNFKSCEEAYHSIDMQSWNIPIFADRNQMDDISFLGEGKSTPNPLLTSRESVPSVTSMGLIKGYVKSQSPYIVSVEKQSSQPSGPSKTTSTEKCVPAVLVRQTMDSTSYSDRKFCSSGDYYFCDDNAKANFFGNNLSNSKDTLMFGSDLFEGEMFIDSSHLNIHVKGNEPLISKWIPAKVEVEKDATEEEMNKFFKADSGIHILPLSPCVGLPMNVNETSNAFEDTFESVDNYNSAVDSPCWKGALVPHVSPFESSDTVNKRQLEACNSLNHPVSGIHGVNNDNMLEISAPRLSEGNQDWDLPKDLAPSPKLMPVAHSVLEEHKINDISKSGSLYINLCGRPSYNLRQSEETNKLPSRERNTLASDSLEDLLNQVAFDAAEHVIHSPSCAEDEPMKLSEEVSPKLDVKTLVDTMYTQSELLLFHCSNGLSDLQEKDLQSLEKVIQKLKFCILKSADHTAPTQFMSPLPRKGAYHRLSSEVGQYLMPEVEAANLCQVNDLVSGRNDRTTVNSVSTTNDASSMKEDNMAKALKKVLYENFHDDQEPHPQALMYKNLWLEAEAALYSKTFNTRFNRVKMDMEKYKLQNVKAEILESDTQGDPNPKTSGESPSSSTCRQADNDRGRVQLLNCGKSESVDQVNMRKLSSRTLAANQRATKKIALAKSCSSAANVSNHDFPLYNSNVGADEASTASSFPPQSMSTATLSDDMMARFHILKGRGENLNPAGTTSGSSIYRQEIKTGELALKEEEASLNADVSMKDSSNLGEVWIPKDVDSSVMARFHILKKRGDNLGATRIEQQWQPEMGDQFVTSRRNYWAIQRSEMINGKGEYVLSHQDSSGMENKLARKVGNAFHAGYDNSSSDWEHIMREEAGGESS